MRCDKMILPSLTFASQEIKLWEMTITPSITFMKSITVQESIDFKQRLIVCIKSSYSQKKPARLGTRGLKYLKLKGCSGSWQPSCNIVGAKAQLLSKIG